ncbi:MAG: hypothetical protein IKJ61_04395 [Bacteroidaceae bacterium]|nr:hypothetical protein [Bacteroidaceae bacterium]
MTDYICVNIVDTDDNNQKCLILYHEDGITLETQRGNIDSNLKTADIYFKRGFTIETLRKCLVKIASALQSNCPNVTNINYAINYLQWRSDTIIQGNAIIEYDLFS